MERYSELSPENNSVELEAKLMDKIPPINAWIDNTLEHYKNDAQTVGELGIKDLNLFYPEALLSRAKVVIVEKVKQIPVASEFGIEELTDFENMDISGITYKDTYFVEKISADIESLHAHELVHVIQWQYLGDAEFLQKYGKSLLESGYHESVFEEMARRHQRNFSAYLMEQKGEPYNIEEAVLTELNELFPKK